MRREHRGTDDNWKKLCIGFGEPGKSGCSANSIGRSFYRNVEPLVLLGALVRFRSCAIRLRAIRLERKHVPARFEDLATFGRGQHTLFGCRYFQTRLQRPKLRAHVAGCRQP